MTSAQDLILLLHQSSNIAIVNKHFLSWGCRLLTHRGIKVRSGLKLECEDSHSHLFLKQRFMHFKADSPKINLCITPSMCRNLHLLPLYNRITCATVSKTCQQLSKILFHTSKGKFCFWYFLCAVVRRWPRDSKHFSCLSELCATAAAQNRRPSDTDWLLQPVLFWPPRYPRHVLRVKILTCKINLNAWTNIIHKIQQMTYAATIEAWLTYWKNPSVV